MTPRDAADDPLAFRPTDLCRWQTHPKECAYWQHGDFLRLVRIFDPQYRAADTAPTVWHWDHRQPGPVHLAPHTPPLRHTDPHRRDLFGEPVALES